MFSVRYSNEGLNARLMFMKLCGWLQGKKVVALRSDVETCTRVLASSDTKGDFIEALIACPAWSPVLSIESVDGDTWQALSKAFRAALPLTGWQTRIAPLTRAHVEHFGERERAGVIIDAEQISRLTANIFFELMFDRRMSQEEEDFFYRASVEWRKEIAVKGRGDKLTKSAFMDRLRALVLKSRFAALLREHDELILLSALAQPMVLSPQINFSDIMAAIFKRFRADESLHARAMRAAYTGDLEWLRGVCLESIRLEHPFPVLERELSRDLEVEQGRLEKGTQVFIMLDELEQDQTFDPGRWAKHAENPYRALPFGAGPRVCLGKALATDLLGELLRGLLVTFPPSSLRPEDNHLYSGRDNDGDESFLGALHQAKTFSRALFASWSLGQTKSAVGGTRGRCPVTGRGG